MQSSRASFEHGDTRGYLVQRSSCQLGELPGALSERQDLPRRRWSQTSALCGTIRRPNMRSWRTQNNAQLEDCRRQCVLSSTEVQVQHDQSAELILRYLYSDVRSTRDVTPRNRLGSPDSLGIGSRYCSWCSAQRGSQNPQGLSHRHGLTCIPVDVAFGPQAVFLASVFWV